MITTKDDLLRRGRSPVTRKAHETLSQAELDQQKADFLNKGGIIQHAPSKAAPYTSHPASGTAGL